MGSDNLFHKRKARARNELERRARARERSKRFLIVTEGSKTEPHYFREMRCDLDISPQLLTIVDSDGSSPQRVLDFALKAFEQDAIHGDRYDKVYCVFDRDRHSGFDATVARIRDLQDARVSRPFEAITSTPCFEFWFLLHFGFSDRPFQAAGKRSTGDQVVAELRAHPGFNEYGKAARGIYATLKPRQHTAMRAAQQLRSNAAGVLYENPSTEVDVLIGEILAMVKE